MLTTRLWARAIMLAAFAPLISHAATIWTGPNITWTKSASTPSDTIIPGAVVLTRGSRDVMYNTAAGETATSSRASSPKDTLWAFGTLANATSLSYATLESLRNGNLAARILNKDMVVHLINEDIYFSIKFTAWGRGGSGTVSYTRSTPPVVVAPTVTLTAPTEGAVFTAPANITLSADASVSGGTVNEVSFFNNGVLVGTDTTSPFSFNANNLAAGTYAFTAVATASGASATSSIVHVTVNAPAAAPTVTLTAPADGSVFTAPANITLSAEASVSGGTVNEVSFFNNGVLVGTDSSSPFSFDANNLAAGTYAFSAVATASGVSATSGVVHVTVNAPAVDIVLSQPAINNGIFSFSYNASRGQQYVVQAATAINPSGAFNWAPVSTNFATGSTGTYSENVSSVTARFFRVARLP